MLQCLHKPWEWLLLIGQFLMLSKQDKTIIWISFSYFAQKIEVSVLILRLKAKCLLKKLVPFIVEFTLNFNSCIFFLGTNTSVKLVAKITCLFRGQIDSLIIFGRDILNFIAGLAQWRGLAQTLQGCMSRPNYLSWSTAAMLTVVVVRSRSAYAPRSNTTSHNDHEKRYSWVPMSMVLCSTIPL